MREDKAKFALRISILTILAIDAIAIIAAIVFGILLGIGTILQSKIMIIAAIVIAAINVLEIILIPIVLNKYKG